MKKSFFITTGLFLLLCTTLSVQAEEVGLKVDKVDTTQDTTISIKKGDVSTKKKYVISEGQEDITGDKDVVMKKAEGNWKKACEDWKKEFKEMNKDNKIISLSCGKMSCSKEGVESTCESKATHKVRVISEE